MKEFKAGDLVYYPDKGTQVFQLEPYSGLGPFPVCICFDDGDDDDEPVVESFTSDGYLLSGHETPKIFHVTEENHALLEKLYGKEFQKPPTKPTSRDIIQVLLNSGQKYVPCYVSSGIVAPNGGSYLDFIVCVHNDGRFYNQLGGGWKYATPFDPKTGQPITEMPE